MVFAVLLSLIMGTAALRAAETNKGDAAVVEVIGRVASADLKKLEQQYPGKIVHVQISQFAFDPVQIVVKPGTVVIWENKDNIQHNVDIGRSSENKLTKAVVAPLLNRNSRWAAIFHQPGVYSYTCDPHLSMQGTVRVEQ